VFICLRHDQTNGKHSHRSGDPDPAGPLGWRVFGTIRVKAEITAGRLYFEAGWLVREIAGQADSWKPISCLPDYGT